MYLKTEIEDLDEFEAWGQASKTRAKICDAGLGETFIKAIEDQYPYGISPTELNDLLWFNDEYCLSLVGLSK